METAQRIVRGLVPGPRIRAFLHSLRFKLLVSHLALAVLPLALASLVFYRFMLDEVERKVSDSTLDRLAAMSAIIDQKVGFVLSFVDGFLANEEINKILSRKFEGYAEAEVNAVSAALARGAESGLPIRSMMLATRTGHLYRRGTWEELDAGAILDEVLGPAGPAGASGPAVRWLGVRRSGSVSSAAENVLALVGVLKRFTDFSDLGVLYIELSSKGLCDFGPAVERGRRAYLVGAEGLVLASSDPAAARRRIGELGLDLGSLAGGSGYFRERVDGEPALVSYLSSPLTGWRLVEYRSFASLLPETDYFKRFFLFAVAALALGSGMLSLLISSRISRPVVRLSALMRRMDAGDLDVSISLGGRDEIRSLGESFNCMASRLRDSIARIVEEEKAKKRLEFEALQAQIGPHFLYNTLGSIQWMAIIHELPSIADMASSLARLLRLSLSSPDPLVSLELEADMLGQYVHILNVRYNDSIDFSASIEPGLESVKVPRLLLQPLVENAILHGMDAEGSCKVEVRCERAGGGLVLSVRDDGAGMDPERLAEILTDVPLVNISHNAETSPATDLPPAAGPKSRERRGIGLRNVNERIRLCYGEAYGLSARRGEAGGTVVEARLPLDPPAGRGL